MILTCTKNDLLEGINIVSKAISNRTAMPILECILLECKDNVFSLMGNDLEIGIISKVNANISKEGQVAIDAKIFSEIIRRLPEKEIYMELDDKNVVTIKCDLSEYKIMGQLADEYPKPKIIEKNKGISIFQSDLKNMIRQTIFSVAIEESKPILTGELVEINEGFINVVAIDGYRISYRKNIIESNESVKVVIPGKTMNEINKILSSELDKKVNLYFEKNYVLFEIENSVIISRLLEGEFYPYKQIFSDDYNTRIKANKSELLASIERASLISNINKKEPVKIQIEDKILKITSNTSIGTAFEQIEVEKEGEDLSIAFNPKYLIEALKIIDDEYINIKYTTSLSPCIISPVASDEYKYLILPVRLNN